MLRRRSFLSRFRFQPRLTNLERRETPAVATLSAGVLTVNYVATGVSNESVTFTNDGTDIVLTGGVSGALSNPVGSVNKIVLTASGPSTNQSAVFAGTATYTLSGGLNSTGVDSVTVSAGTGFDCTGASILTITASKTIVVHGPLSTDSGDLTLLGNTQVTASTGTFDGIDVDANVSSVSGNITMTGKGGNYAGGYQYGIGIFGTAIIGGSTTGKVALNGTGGASSGSDFNIGVALLGGPTITSGGGDVSVTGKGGGVGAAFYSHGIYVDAIITAGGSGAVKVDGTGGTVTGTDNYGVWVLSTGSITSGGGNISITGKGGGSSASNFNLGIVNDAPITAPGTASLTMTGTGGVGSGGANVGVYVGNPISTTDGDLTITGTGGGTGTAPSGFGVYVTDTVGAGGTGKTKITGTGATTTVASAHGVYVFAGKITSAGGDVSITGTRGNTLSDGIRLNADTTTATPGVIDSVGSANIVMTATGGINLIDGQITAPANLTMNATAAIVESSSITLNVAGTMTINASSQTATFNSTLNTVAQLVIPTNVTVLVNGSFDASGAVQVTGKLGGTSGSVGTVTVLSGGKLAPGASPGQLTSGNITFNSGSSFTIELNSNVPVTGYDQLLVNGSVDLGNATLSTTLGYTPLLGEVFTIIDNDTNSDPVTGTFNGLAEGATYTVGATNFKVSYIGGDGNDVTLTVAPAAPPPTVTGVTFGDGTSQRSTVRQIVVTFSEAVAFSPSVVSAFTVHRSGNSLINGNPIGDVTLTASPPTGPASSVTITFSGSFTESNNSLIDGLYDFTIDATKVSGVGGALDGNNDTVAGGNYSTIGSTGNGYFRLFGDSNGDGTVNQTDFNSFRLAFLAGPNTVFDFDNDGQVSQPDYNAFRLRFLGAP